MKTIFLITTLVNLMFADIKVLSEYKISHREVVNETWYDYKIQKLCQNGYLYTVVFIPNQAISITQDFRKSADSEQLPIECKDK